MIEDRNSTRDQHLYQTFSNNCANLVEQIEAFVNKLDVTLVDLKKERTLHHTRVPKLHHAPILIFYYQMFLILMHKWLMNFLFFVPPAAKVLGRGVGVRDKNGEIRGQLKALQWKANVYPKNIRVRQLYSKRLAKHSATYSS
jgi:hypothetical protein